MAATELDVIVYFSGLFTEPSPARSFVAFTALGAGIGVLSGLAYGPSASVCEMVCAGTAVVGGGIAAALEASARQEIACPVPAAERASRAWRLAWTALLAAGVLCTVGCCLASLW